MPFRLLTAAALIAAPIAVAPLMAQNTPSVMPAPNATMFLKKAAASDKFEIQSAKLMVMSSNPQIKRFAQQMITDHTQSTAAIGAAAKQAGLVVPAPVYNSTQQTNLEKLNSVNGKARDAMYVTQQKAAHTQALSLMQSYAAGGKVAPLRDAASKIVPVVQGHIDMLNAMPAA